MGKGLERGECTTEELAPEEAVFGWSVPVAVTGRVTVCGRTLPSGPPHHSPNARSPADQIPMWVSWRSSFVSPKCSLEAPLCWGESCESSFECK
jgi:hypothetical protein